MAVKQSFDLVIIGAGASGLAAAIAAAQTSTTVQILVLEAQDRPGRKILASGNGRCNISNLNLDQNNFCGRDQTLSRSLIYRFSTTSLRYFLDQLGIVTVSDAEGRIYPLSNQAATVLSLLLEACAIAQIEVRTESPVIRLERVKENWLITLLSGQRIKSRRVIIATGSLAAPQLGGSRAGYNLGQQLELDIVPVYPALTPLLLAEKKMCKSLKGQRFRGSATLLSKTVATTFLADKSFRNQKNKQIMRATADLTEKTSDSLAQRGNEQIFQEPTESAWRQIQSARGEFLLTDYGLSGIAAMELSGKVAAFCEVSQQEGPELPVKRAKLRPIADSYPLTSDKEFQLKIDLVPDFSDTELRAKLWQRLGQISPRQADRLFSGLLPLRLAEHLGHSLRNEIAKLPKDRGREENPSALLIDLAISTLRSWRLNVTGVRGYEQAQISLGGIATEMLDANTMEVKHCPGLYIAGEVLDVAGNTGGYNLHFAFASGIIAGESAGKALA